MENQTVVEKTTMLKKGVEVDSFLNALVDNDTKNVILTHSDANNELALKIYQHIVGKCETVETVIDKDGTKKEVVYPGNCFVINKDDLDERYHPDDITNLDEKGEKVGNKGFLWYSPNCYDTFARLVDVVCGRDKEEFVVLFDFVEKDIISRRTRNSEGKRITWEEHRYQRYVDYVKDNPNVRFIFNMKTDFDSIGLQIHGETVTI